MLWLTQRVLRSKNTAARRKAVEQLCDKPRSGSRRVLQKALSDEDAEVRRLAAQALGKLEDERCIEPLLAALRDRDADVVKAVILALKQTPDERVVSSLTPLLRHGDAGVRGHAAQVLEALAWRPADPEDEIWLEAAKGQFARVAAFGPAAVPVLEFVVEASPYGQCVRAVEALGEIRDQRALRPLLGALKSDDAAVCVAALDALWRLGDPRALEPIVATLRHRNAAVRVAAIETLRRLDAVAAVEPLREMLRDSGWDVRRAAAEALGRLRDPRALTALAEALEDADGDVREASAMALGTLGGREAIGPLVLALKDATSGVRRIAAAALSRIDPNWNVSPEAQTAVEKLKSALEQSDSNVRHFVGQLLVNLGEAEPGLTVPPAQAPEEELTVSSSAKRRKLAVSLFVSLLVDADRDLRQAAAEALGRLGDERAKPRLARAVGDADAGVRDAAEQALRAFETAR
jgi:HEAT repeat protein